MRKKDSFLFVTDKLSEGGAERSCAVFASEFAELGYDVTLLANRVTQDEYPVSPKLRIIRLPLDKLFLDQGFVLRNLKRMPILIKIIRQVNPSYIIPFMASNTIIMVIANFFCRKEVVGTVRTNFAVPYNYLPNWVRDMFYTRCHKIWCQTVEQVSYFSTHLQKRCFVVPNCCRGDLLESGSRRKYSPQIRTISTCGRLIKCKNHALLIEAFSKLTDPNCILNIYGKGEQEENLKLLAKRLGLNSRVFFKGWTNDIAEAMSESDLFVLTSDWEGMPNALMEAMTCGVPCIATDCPTGPAELITNRETGLLIPMGNAQALSDAMSYMIQHPEFAEKCGKAGHAFVNQKFASKMISIRLHEEIVR